MRVILALVCIVPVPVIAQEPDLATRLKTTYAEAADELIRQQDDVGAWGVVMPDRKVPSVAYTALIVSALIHSPVDLRPKYKHVIEKAARFLLSKANPDGSFGEGESGTYMKTYATAVTLSALSSVEWTEKVNDAMRGARAYLKQNQLKEGLHRGGEGYGEEEPRRNADTGEWEVKRSTVANLSATAMVAEAMKDAGISLSDDFWTLAAEYVRKCQNSTDVNKDPALLAAFKEKGLSVGNEGDLYYTAEPNGGLQKAGTRKIADRETIVGYGSMTYDGIKTYLYAGLLRDSPEVKAAVDWVRRNYSIEAHPGFLHDRAKRDHLRGIFYYYLVMARALHAYGERPFITSDGREHDWPKELAEKMLSTIRESKSWENDNPAWFEGDTILTTSYVLNVLDILIPYLR
jgi:squalene-hopene/tetraprenyl-beta-curcumene cyclase